MTPDDDPLNRLRGQFVAAAERDIAQREASSPRAAGRPRWRRPWVFIPAIFVATAGFAAANGLISIGSPTKDKAGKPPAYAPGDRRRAVLTAPDKTQTLPWGVGIYESSNGHQCAIAGAARGRTLGTMSDGTFHPYAANFSGTCGDLTKAPSFIQIVNLGGRRLVFGRSRSDVKTVRLRTSAGTFKSPTGAGGAFLFVLDQQTNPTGFDLVLRNGRVVRAGSG